MLPPFSLQITTGLSLVFFYYYEQVVSFILPVLCIQQRLYQLPPNYSCAIRVVSILVPTVGLIYCKDSNPLETYGTIWLCRSSMVNQMKFKEVINLFHLILKGQREKSITVLFLFLKSISPFFNNTDQIVTSYYIYCLSNLKCASVS